MFYILKKLFVRQLFSKSSLIFTKGLKSKRKEKEKRRQTSNLLGNKIMPTVVFTVVTLGDEAGLRQGRPLALRVTVGGLLCLGCLEERESRAPWLAYPVSTFTFPQAT